MARLSASASAVAILFSAAASHHRDESGVVDYEEFEWMVRHELNTHPSNLPDASLHSLWNALDSDDSGTPH